MYRRRILRALWVLAAAVAIYTVSAGACSCMPPAPPEQALNGSDAVFSGRAETVQESTQSVTATFTVSRVWKGPESEKLAVTTATSSASCGYPFQEGTTYLVYAQETAETANVPLTVSLCSRTTNLEDAEQDIHALGPGTAMDDGQPRTGENRTPHRHPSPGFGTGLFLATIVPPLLALISVAMLILLATGRNGRWLAVTGSISTVGGLIGVYALVSNPNTTVLLTEDPLFAAAMIAPLLLGATALIRWYTR